MDSANQQPQPGTPPPPIPEQPPQQPPQDPSQPAQTPPQPVPMHQPPTPEPTPTAPATPTPPPSTPQDTTAQPAAAPAAPAPSTVTPMGQTPKAKKGPSKKLMLGVLALLLIVITIPVTLIVGSKQTNTATNAAPQKPLMSRDACKPLDNNASACLKVKGCEYVSCANQCWPSGTKPETVCKDNTSTSSSSDPDTKALDDQLKQLDSAVNTVDQGINDQQGTVSEQ